MTSDGFLYQILSITLFSYLNSRERASIFPFQCWLLNKVSTGTIFITSLVWHGPWLGIEFFLGILTIEKKKTSCLHEIEIYTLTICLLSTGGDVKEDSAPESSVVYGSLHETTSFSYCYKVCTEFLTREVNVKAFYLFLYSITHRTLSFSAIDIFFLFFIFSIFHFFLVFIFF